MSTSSPQVKPLEFKHAALRSLDQNQRDAFQRILAKIVSHHKRCTPARAETQKFSNDQVRREMKSLLTHLNHVCAASGPESNLQANFWGQYSGFKVSDDDRKIIAGFPKMAELMRRIVDDSITSKSYKIRPLASLLPSIITMQAAQLLRQFEIKLSVTVGGAWLELTKYILQHGCERDEKTETIRNYLKSCIGYFHAKKGGEKT
jgi:hypothetical protein